MPSALAFIGGGLLTGIGRGLAEDGKAKRERALEDLKFNRRRGLLTEAQNRADKRQATADKRADARQRLSLGAPAKGFRNTPGGGREFIPGGSADPAVQRRKAEATRTPDQTLVEIGDPTSPTGSRFVKRADALNQPGKPRSGKSGDASAAEKRAFESLIEIHTFVDENKLETTDWDAIAQGLEDKGFGKLAKSVRRRSQGIADQKNREEAQTRAAAEAEEKAGTFSLDSSDFKEDGGSRIRFIKRREREIFDELSGKVLAAKPAQEPRSADGTIPYTGDQPPPDFPDARRRKSDGFWYVKRGGKSQRVMRPVPVAP